MIPLLGGAQVTGKVNLAQPDDGGWARVGGGLTGSRQGSFSLATNGKVVVGTILLPKEELAYVIIDQGGKMLMQEQPIADVICIGLPRDSADGGRNRSNQPNK